MAERVRRVGGTTIRSISHIGQLQTIKDDNSAVVPAGDMVRILMEDNGHIAKKKKRYIVSSYQLSCYKRDLCTSRIYCIRKRKILLLHAEEGQKHWLAKDYIS
jgi:DNA-binding ferritin-like protein